MKKPLNKWLRLLLYFALAFPAALPLVLPDLFGWDKQWEHQLGPLATTLLEYLYAGVLLVPGSVFLGRWLPLHEQYTRHRVGRCVNCITTSAPTTPPHSAPNAAANPSSLC
ncbi:MAG: hypothetical protein ACTHN5_19420 [Phycisphaerae bacterium]